MVGIAALDRRAALSFERRGVVRAPVGGTDTWVVMLRGEFDRNVEIYIVEVVVAQMVSRQGASVGIGAAAVIYSAFWMVVCLSCGVWGEVIEIWGKK